MPADVQPTCGKGLAEHARLPDKLAELTAAVADVLEHHLATLDLTDDDSRREDAAYRSLVENHRRAARDLRAIAEEMAGYRDLPMGRHDLAALSQPDALRPFATLVRLEEELLVLLQARLQQDHAMLEQTRHPSESV
jgi:hypothetical protein